MWSGDDGRKRIMVLQGSYEMAGNREGLAKDPRLFARQTIDNLKSHLVLRQETLSLDLGKAVRVAEYSIIRIATNRGFYGARVLFLGLVTAQILATAQVYLSNAHLYRSLTAIKDAGYLAIPNQRIMDSLGELSPAFFGGLFFTLSVGAGLSLICLAAVWVWDRLLSRNRYLLSVFALVWMGCLAEVNRRGFCPMVTSYFLLIPVVVVFASIRWMPAPFRQGIWLNKMAHGIPVLLLALLWTSQMDSHLFLDLRDNLLLSNPLGAKINDFYYRYTPYPAEVFKTLDQKTLKTCDLENIQQKPLVRSMERALLKHDYLHVGGDGPVDLKIAQGGNGLVFENRGREILRTTAKDFISCPGTVLKAFSLKSDRHTFFRRFTFFSLLIGFPLTLYAILYTLCRLVSGFFLDARVSSVVASALCFAIGVTVLVVFHCSRGKEIEVKDLTEALKSEHWQKRVAGLKIIGQKGMEVSDFQAYHGMLTSPHVPERYWLVRALGVSRQSETYRDLLALLDDPHPNVVRMAFYALGQRADRRAVTEIMKRIEASTDWYNQWYAYKALRALGWKQTRLKQKP